MFFRWRNKLIAKQLPNYREIISDPLLLAQAIAESRVNGSSVRLRCFLASAGISFINNERLIDARRDALLNDTSPRVRRSALNGLLWSGSFSLSEGIYSRGTREAIEVGVTDKDSTVRMGAEMHLKEFDRSVRKMGLAHELPAHAREAANDE